MDWLAGEIWAVMPGLVAVAWTLIAPANDSPGDEHTDDRQDHSPDSRR